MQFKNIHWIKMLLKSIGTTHNICVTEISRTYSVGQRYLRPVSTLNTQITRPSLSWKANGYTAINLQPQPFMVFCFLLKDIKAWFIKKYHYSRFFFVQYNIILKEIHCKRACHFNYCQIIRDVQKGEQYIWDTCNILGSQHLNST